MRSKKSSFPDITYQIIVVSSDIKYKTSQNSQFLWEIKKKPENGKWDTACNVCFQNLFGDHNFIFFLGRFRGMKSHFFRGERVMGKMSQIK